MCAKQIDNFPAGWVLNSAKPTQEELIGRGIAKSLDNLNTWVRILRQLGENDLIDEIKKHWEVIFEPETASKKP